MFRKTFAIALLVLAAAGLAATPSMGQTDGSFPVTFKNATDGRWKDSQIFITAIGQTTPGQWAYLKADGTAAPIDHTMATAPGHLTKDGVDYPNMSVALSQAGGMRIPPEFQGTRLYISVGEPMYFGVSSDDKGWVTPDLHNKDNPNIGTTFDWYELTYKYGQIPFGGNTTQVDQFGLPMTVRLQQASTGYDETRGITLSRKQVFDRFEESVAKPFHSLVGPNRIIAPRTGAEFAKGGRHDDYLQPVIDKAWKDWEDGFKLTRLGQTFRGRTSGNTLTFTQDGVNGPFSIRKPTTQQVFQCSGALAPAGAPPEEGVMGAELCAAFNRGVSGDTDDWWKASTYYPHATLDNDYSSFFHAINKERRAYGFAYDDINDQSSVTILKNAQPPSALTINVGW